MQVHRLDPIPFEPDIRDMLRRMNISGKSSPGGKIAERLLEGARVAVPKAVYGEALIGKRGTDYIVADGICFTSRVLRVNTGNTDRLYPFLVTCGTELENWSQTMDAPLEKYVAALIEEEACRAAMHRLFKTIDIGHCLRYPSAMNPGSVEDWPISQQRNLFQLLKGAHADIGIELLESLLMKPARSMSGVRFSGIHPYTNCQICPRGECAGRMEPYDPERAQFYRCAPPNRGETL